MYTWQQLDEEFQKLLPELLLLRIDVTIRPDEEQWRPAGWQNRSSLVRFEALARTAGEKLTTTLKGCPEYKNILVETDPILRWYRALANVAGAMKPFLAGIAYDVDETGRRVGSARLGVIENVVEESASLCARLMSLYSEPEHQHITTTERLQRRILDNPVVAVILLFVVIFGGVAKFLGNWESIMSRFGWTSQVEPPGTDRSLTAEQLRQLAARVGAQPPNCSAQLSCNYSDDEACAYARQLYAAFVIAGWSVQPPSAVLDPLRKPGLSLRSNAANPAAIRLAAELGEMEKQVRRVEDDSLRDACSIEVEVGTKWY